MPNKKVVLDTNCLLASLSKQGRVYPVWKGFQEGRYTLCVTTDILEEYEEIIARKTTPALAKNVIDLIVESENVELVNAYYHWNLITADPDDNKFVDCAFLPERHTSFQKTRTLMCCETLPFLIYR